MSSSEYLEANTTKLLVYEMIAKGYLAALKDLVRLCYNPAHEVDATNGAILCGAGLIDLKKRLPTCPDEIKQLLIFRGGEVFLGGCNVAKQVELNVTPNTSISVSNLVTEHYKLGRVR